jgi:MYND finger
MSEAEASAMTIEQRFVHLGRQGAILRSQGDLHASTEAFFEAFKFPADQINYCDRVLHFHSLAATALDLDIRVTNQELEALHNIVNRPQEPFLIRSLAVTLYATLNVTRGDRDRAGDAYRKAMALVGEAPDDERLRHCYVNSLDANEPCTIRVQATLESIRRHAHKKLQLLEHPFGTDNQGMGPSTAIPVQGRGVGGNECDCCHNTLTELGLTLMDHCSRCEAAYYCSKECQKKQWKAGHKHVCREKGVFQLGDRMKMRAVDEENWCLATVIVQRQEANGKWLVNRLADRTQLFEV